MARSIGEIDARVAELDKFQAQEHAREKRVLETEAAAFAKLEEAGRGPLRLLFDHLKVPAAQVKELYELQEAGVRQLVAEVIPQLQLTREELLVVRQEQRAVQLLNPYVLIPQSHCQFHASSWGWWHYETANAACSCTANLANNELNPKAEAYGQADLGFRSAALDCWLWFELIPYPSPCMLNIHIKLELHGFYIVKPGLGQATLRVDLEGKGFQYGYSWGGATKNILNLAGNAMGFYNSFEDLTFTMPVQGGDPFQVRVMLKIRARSKGAGSVALADFSTGAGNYMKVWWVNPVPA